MPKTVSTVALGVIASAALLPTAADAATIRGAGSSASTPYIEALYKEYKKVDKKNTFTWNPNNGNQGAKDVQNGQAEFAIQTRPPQFPVDSGLAYVKLWLDALTISAHPSNPLTNISTAQTKDIFTGKLTQWSGVTGATQTGAIQPHGRFSTAGLYTFFKASILGGAEFGSNVTPHDKDGDTAVAVASDPQAIGYVGLANSKPANKVKRLNLNGIAPTEKTIRNEKYPLFRYGWLVIKQSSPNKEAIKFGDWVRLSYGAGVVLTKQGAVTYSNEKKKGQLWPTKKKKKKSKKK